MSIYQVLESFLSVLLLPCLPVLLWLPGITASTDLPSVSQGWARGAGNPPPVHLVAFSHLTIFSLSFFFYQKITLNYHLEYQHLTLFVF